MAAGRGDIGLRRLGGGITVFDDSSEGVDLWIFFPLLFSAVDERRRYEHGHVFLFLPYIIGWDERGLSHPPSN